MARDLKFSADLAHGVEEVGPPCPTLSHTTLMTYFKAQDNPETFGSLYVPSEKVYTALAYMENSFDSSFNNIYHMPKLMQGLKYRFTNGLSNINFPDCHNVLDIIIDTLCKTRMYRAIENMNEKLKRKSHPQIENIKRWCIYDFVGLYCTNYKSINKTIN